MRWVGGWHCVGVLVPVDGFLNAEMGRREGALFCSYHHYYYYYYLSFHFHVGVITGIELETEKNEIDVGSPRICNSYIVYSLVMLAVVIILDSFPELVHSICWHDS